MNHKRIYTFHFFKFTMLKSMTLSIACRLIYSFYSSALHASDPPPGKSRVYERGRQFPNFSDVSHSTRLEVRMPQVTQNAGTAAPQRAGISVRSGSHVLTVDSQVPY